MIASISRTGLALGLASALSGAALAQDAEQLDKLKSLYEQLAGEPERIVSVEAGRDALASLDDLVLDESSLEPAQLAQMLLCRIYALAAIGDARSIDPYLSELQRVQPDRPVTHRAEHLAASVVGDGRLGSTALAALGKPLDKTAKRRMASMARRFRIVGSPAPALSVKADNGADFDLVDRRGKVLILFLWSIRREPSSRQIAAMRRIYAELSDNSNVEFLGVSANPATLDGKARGFARSRGLSWPHHFENRGTGAPITHKAFRAGSTPAQIVIDSDGIVRAVGEIGEPAMVYATRAAVAEADGQYTPADSRASNGKVTPRGVARTARSGNRQAKKPPSDQLEDNREAENLLSQARLMIRIRNRQNAKRILQRIIREYPNTKQAKRALEMLTDLP